MKKQNKICVYTCLMGDYEDLNEQNNKNSSVDFLCFTDNLNLKSDSWKIIYINPVINGDISRSQRMIKLRPHVYLDKYDTVMYIDNSVILKKDPIEICKITNAFDYDMIINHHSERESLYEEFLMVGLLKYDSVDRLYEQAFHYKEKYPDVLNEKPFWGGFFIANIKRARVKDFFEKWSSHVLRFSRRDQLSANVAFLESKLNINVLSYNNNLSSLHSWPHANNRKKPNYVNLREAYSLKDLVKIIEMTNDSNYSAKSFFSNTEKNIMFGDLFLGSGGNSSGSGGKINFGIEDLSLRLPMASINSRLINANIETFETQGDLEFSTRKVGDQSQSLIERFIIKNNGSIRFMPIKRPTESPDVGDAYVDSEENRFFICLIKGKWSYLIINNCSNNI